MQNTQPQAKPNKRFQVRTKNGSVQIVIIRQLAHDTQYRVGSKIPGYGVVMAVLEGGN